MRTRSRVAVALAALVAAGGVGLALARDGGPQLCDQETATAGMLVTYGAGSPGCVPQTLAYGDERQPPGGRVSVPPLPCASDDGPGPCWWDAQKRGNGRGTSVFIPGR